MTNPLPPDLDRLYRALQGKPTNQKTEEVLGHVFSFIKKRGLSAVGVQIIGEEVILSAAYRGVRNKANYLHPSYIAATDMYSHYYPLGELLYAAQRQGRPTIQFDGKIFTLSEATALFRHPCNQIYDRVPPPWVTRTEYPLILVKGRYRRPIGRDRRLAFIAALEILLLFEPTTYSFLEEAKEFYLSTLLLGNNRLNWKG